ncbi:MAG: polysaccharide deacetylase [Acidobacteria bacterium]|nr:polysaccharide deacetylase [Acidobacteriota bacterium]
MTRQLIDALAGAPATIFVNSGQARYYTDQGLDELLALYRLPNIELGNHTFTHPDLNKIALAEYQAEILRAEPAIRKARGGTQSRYFRHTFLHVGPTKEIREGLRTFLKEHNYIEAPVSIDTSDWMFARVYTDTEDKAKFRKDYLDYMAATTAFFEQRAQAVLGQDIPQILLIHANQLNADSMPALLKLFRERGYQIVSLDQALQHPAYQQPDTYYGPSGFSWLHRWAITKGLKPVYEPEEPAWLKQAFAKK